MERIVGPSGRGQAGGGLAFVIASAGAVPGGSATVQPWLVSLQLLF